MPWSRTFKLDGSDDAAIEDFVETHITHTMTDTDKLLERLKEVAIGLDLMATTGDAFKGVVEHTNSRLIRERLAVVNDAAATIRALLTRLRLAEERADSAWKPIEIAPKIIGKKLWVLDTDSGEDWCYECTWNGLEWYHGFGDYWPKANPTHWMLPIPRPTPPAKDESK